MEIKQPNNPTDEERHLMLRNALEAANHLEDYQNLLELLGPPPDITTIASPLECRDIKVGIIGGGLAGLSSAFELRKLGFDITIFESQENRIGGRVYTYYFDKERKLYGELGAMRIPVSHETLWHYINLFGLDTRPFVQSNENAFIYVRNKRARNDPNGKNVMEKIYPEFDLTLAERNTSWQMLFDYALGTPFLDMSKEVRREILEIKERYSDQLTYYDSLSIRKVLALMGLSEGAIEMLGNVVSLAGSFYNYSYFESLQETYTVDSAYRYEVVGGMVRIPHAFYHSLMSKNPKEYTNIEADSLGKVVWKNGNIVTGIYKASMDNGTVTLEYKDSKSLQAFSETFDFVICAIPFSSLRNVMIYPMFSTTKMQAIEEVTYVSAQKTIFKCKKRFWEMGSENERILGGGSYTDLPITSIWYPSDHANLSREKYEYYNLYKQPGVLLASYNLTLNALRLGNLDSRLRFPSIKRQVEAVHGLPPGYLDSIVEDTKTIQWDNEAGFYGGFCYYMPEQKSLFSYAMIQPEYNNRVYFAGEHVSSTHAWQQGAVNSGMKAANAIANYCREIYK